MSTATPPRKAKRAKPLPALSSESDGDSPITRNEKRTKRPADSPPPPDDQSAIPETIKLASKPPPPYTGLYIRYCEGGTTWKRELYDPARLSLVAQSKQRKDKSVVENIEVTYRLQSGRSVPVIFQTPEMFILYNSFEKVWKEGGKPETTFAGSFEFRNYDEFVAVLKQASDEKEPDCIKFYRDLAAFEDYVLSLLITNSQTLLPGLEPDEDEPDPAKAITRVFDRITKRGKKKGPDGRPMLMPPVLKLKIDKYDDSDFQVQAYMRIDGKDGEKPMAIPTHVTSIKAHSKVIMQFTYDTLMLINGKIYPKRRLKQVTLTALPSATVAPMTCDE